MRFKLQRNSPMPTPGPLGSPRYYDTPAELKMASTKLDDACLPFWGAEADNGDPIDYDLIIAAIHEQVVEMSKVAKANGIESLSHEELIAFEREAIANIQRGGT